MVEVVEMTEKRLLAPLTKDWRDGGKNEERSIGDLGLDRGEEAERAKENGRGKLPDSL